MYLAMVDIFYREQSTLLIEQVDRENKGRPWT